jgi:cyclophilin family peptidyl-prolyl cis-trans isomerase
MVNMWLAEELYYRGINNYIQAYMGDTLVWEKSNNDYFYVENTSSMYNSIGFTMRKVKAEYPLGDYDETSVTDLIFSPTLQYSLDGINWNDYTAYLDGNYAAFGKVTDGIEVVDEVVKAVSKYGDSNGMLETKYQPIIEYIKVTE